MEIMYLLIPLSVILVFLIGVVFWWSVRNGQFDDMEGPGYRVLMDNDEAVSERAVEKVIEAVAEAAPEQARDANSLQK